MDSNSLSHTRWNCKYHIVFTGYGYKGGRNFIVGIGGSATIDGGVGRLQALGYSFFTKENRLISRGIRELGLIDQIDCSHVLPKLKACSFQIACDVKNPLYGENGAVCIYGSQKGVKEEEQQILDEKMKYYAEKTREYCRKDYSWREGVGAVGGLGFVFASYMPNVTLRSGIDIIMEVVGLEQEIQGADIVITGEGRLDSQTVMGKVPVGVAGLARKYNKKLLL